MLLCSGEIISEKNLSLVQDIKSDADSLIVMVENLLSITRIQDGTMPLKKREEMLEEVAGDAVLTTRRRFPSCQVDLDLSEDILYLPMEPMLIKQVMVNLLENAVRHSGDQTTSPSICSARTTGQWWRYGTAARALSPEVCQAVQSGRPLSPRSERGLHPGMGIGLSVCQSIIKAHNGFFAAGNDPEGGAVFRFGLPMEESDDE